jgi:flagellar biogenesis protein FliO
MLGGTLGAVIILCTSDNCHNRSFDAMMTGFFVVGPMLAIIASIIFLVYRLLR